jgi:hypothetical protein
MFSGASQQLLAPSGNVAGNTQCFSVPNDIPTNDEVKDLASVGGAFCTSYIDYNPPMTVSYGISTTTTLSTGMFSAHSTLSVLTRSSSDNCTYNGHHYVDFHDRYNYLYTIHIPSHKSSCFVRLHWWVSIACKLLHEEARSCSSIRYDFWNDHEDPCSGTYSSVNQSADTWPKGQTTGSYSNSY